MPSDEFDRDRQVIEAATDGPWAWAQPGEKENGFVVGAADPPHEGLIEEPEPEIDETTGKMSFPDDHPEVVETVCEQWGATVNYHDAEFIARARTRWPACLDELERLRFENEGLKAAIDFPDADCERPIVATTADAQGVSMEVCESGAVPCEALKGARFAMFVLGEQQQKLVAQHQYYADLHAEEVKGFSRQFARWVEPMNQAAEERDAARNESTKLKAELEWLRELIKAHAKEPGDQPDDDTPAVTTVGFLRELYRFVHAGAE